MVKELTICEAMNSESFQQNLFFVVVTHGEPFQEAGFIRLIQRCNDFDGHLMANKMVIEFF